MSGKKKSNPREGIAARCMSCDRELKIHHADDPRDAVKRKRWSNMNWQTKPPTGSCPSCRKKGNHR